MRLVVDANIIFSALIAKGNALDIFLLNSKLKKFEFIAPEYLFLEIEAHTDKIFKETKLPSLEISEIFDFIKDEIEFISIGEFKQFEEEANKASPDMDDVPYFALALKFNCPMVSGDKVLKRQSVVKVLSPAEVLELLKKE